MRKETVIILGVIFFLCLSFTPNAHAATATFKIIATIPAIVGVNVFEDGNVPAISQDNQRPSDDVMTEKVVRDNQEIVLKTIVVR